mgnify:CR=1 FL=1|jgi:HTH-type transcriptional regulator/antitoxin HigA
MKIQPIKNEKSYELALQRVEKLMGAGPGTPEGDELDVLVTLIEAYESRMHPINTPDPIEAIRFRMQQTGLNNRDLEKYIGSSGRVSEIMNYKRRLSISMIRSLNTGLNIPLESLVKEYELKV